MENVTHVWLYTSMGSLVDIKVRLLVETLGTILDCALVPFLATLGAALFFLGILPRELELTRLSRSICTNL
jgi:hypothetical protein